MPQLFFYGTLRHVPLLEAVLGRDIDPACLTDAVLQGFSVFSVVEGPFPTIEASDGSCVGVLLRDAKENDVAALDFYEGRFGYTLAEVSVDGPDGSVLAQVYFPPQSTWTQQGPWDFKEWAKAWALMSTRAAADIMDLRGTRYEDQAARLLPFFRARAWAKELAADPAPQTTRRDNSVADVEMSNKIGAHKGFFQMNSFDVRYRRFDGTWSGTVPRESFVAYDAALVLPYDPKTDQLLLIEQMRYGPLMRDDPAPWVLEPIAGLIDAGEQPADSARREAVEEAGLELGDLIPMVKTYASPGYTSEFFHCFLGLCDLSSYQAGVGGLVEENEDIRSHLLSFDQAMALVDSGEANAGPLVMMILWLASRRESLRAAA